MSSNIPIYHDYRQRFLSAAAKRGFATESIQDESPSPQGKPLFTDFVYLKNQNPNLPNLIHISGTHGIEGYIGSDVQTEIINSLRDDFFSYANVFFIHAVNPYGMAWYRRVNKNNVDLNRNSTSSPLQNPEFKTFADVLDKSAESKFTDFLKLFLKNSLRHGFAKTMNVIAKGQSEFPNALFFSGRQKQEEILRIEKSLKKIINHPKDIYIIDAHSGLGRAGTDTLLIDGDDEDWVEDHLSKLLDRKILVPQKNSNFYKAAGTMSSTIKSQFPNQKIFHITQEFGTKSILSVFRALFYDNQNFTADRVNTNTALRMLDTYYYSNEGHKQKAIHNGVHLFSKLLAKISQ